tara:strand:+ start:1891 stop:2091 length:201 start_codon:yes stop_codon:yes gene_type:complete
MRITILVLIAAALLAACPLAPYVAPDGTVWPSRQAYEDSKVDVGIRAIFCPKWMSRAECDDWAAGP